MGLTFSTLNSPQSNSTPQPQTSQSTLVGKRKADQTEPNLDSAPQSAAPAAATPSALRPVQRSIRSLGAQLDLVDIPQDLLDKVASHLPNQDLPAVARTHSVMRSATQERLTSLRVSNEVLQVSTLAELQGSLQTINNLPSNLRTEALRNAMLRIQALPPEDKAQAVTELKAAVNQQAANDRPPELPRVENILGQLDPKTAALHGFKVSVVTKAFGIADKYRIGGIESATAESDAPNTAGAAMLAGENLKAIAARFGITTLRGILALELRAARDGSGDTARAAVDAGGNVQDVADRFGFTMDGVTYELERATIRSHAPNTAGAALRAGMSVQEVAVRVGITAQDGLRRLAMLMQHH